MARDVICDLCHVEVAIIMIGDLSNGDQTAFCAACRILDCLGTLDQQLDDATKAAIAQKWAPAPAKPPAAEDGAADAPKRGSGGRRRARQAGDDPQDVVTALQAAAETGAAQDPEPHSRLEEAPAAADDG